VRIFAHTKMVIILTISVNVKSFTHDSDQIEKKYYNSYIYVLAPNRKLKIKYSIKSNKNLIGRNFNIFCVKLCFFLNIVLFYWVFEENVSTQRNYFVCYCVI
jgi:hypothetical protein